MQSLHRAKIRIMKSRRVLYMGSDGDGTYSTERGVGTRE